MKDIETPRGAVSSHRPEIAKVMPIGEVYFVLATVSGLVKIGYAKDARARFSSLQVGSPEELRLIGIIRTYLPAELEADVHAKFAVQRVRGEWFTLTDHLLGYILSHAREDWD